ncbi:MAG: TatD family hydrolase [Clostridia bacterium]|jgi:TatD DNase family protein|nr:TatD family hydrolase [Clostridia bacterium]MCI9413138.1 TatD family hydrolase [Clostridia bacterium]
MELFDSHAHYNDEKFKEDREEVLQAVLDVGVTKLICAGYSVEASKEAVEIASEHQNIYAIVGISPNDIPEKNIEYGQILSEQLQQIEKLALNKKVVAIGEIGLDYYWNKENKEEQKLAFQKQIELANKLNLPIVIHTREAVYDTLDILKNEITPAKKGIFHCCPLNLDLIREGLKFGFYISFAGPITFKNAKNAEEAIRAVPLDRILIETDSPYLAPEPKRGTRNDSRNVRYMAEKIAQVKGMEVEEVAKVTYENAKKIFEIN